MRRFLLSAVALMMTISMMAVGLNNGTSKANAIDFDWANGHTHNAGSALWYRVALSQLSKDAQDPTLALYLTNLSTDAAAVTLTVDAALMGQTASKAYSYNIARNDYQLWSVRSFNVPVLGDASLKELMKLGLTEVFVQLKSNQQIKLTAKAYETEDIVDDACTKAVDFNWAGQAVAKGEKWFRLNLSEIKNSNKQLKFVVKNTGSASAKVAFDMSLDCPASAVIEKDWVIAAGAEQEDEFGRVFLDVLKEDYVFLKLTTNQPLTLAVEEVVVLPPPPGKYDSFVCDAPVLNFDEELNLTAGEHVYKVLRQDLIAARDYAYDFHVTNNNGTAAELKVETAFACPVTSAVEQTLKVEANKSISVGIKGNVLASVNSEWVYLRFTADQDLTAMIGVRNTNPCVNAVPFDWTAGASLNAGESTWYEMDIASLKKNKQHLYLNFVNYASKQAAVSLEIALDCNGTILPLTLPIPAGLNIGQMIDYQFIARCPLDRIYVGVSTNAHIGLNASVKNYIADDQTPCLNAIDMQHGTEYLHQANTTNWYKISLDLLKSKANYSGLYLANKGNKTAHVTIGAVTSCQYTTGTTITIPVPAGLDLGMVAPNILGNLIEELARFDKAYNKVDAADIYLEITTDQPLAFGLDVVNATTSPCLREDLVTFDWNGANKINASQPVWYDIDLNTVKNSGKHIKFTFTNNTDSLVWAVTVVSVDCPAKLTMPFVVPVPAGMSVDKFVEYNFFAVANIDNIYMGVVTDGDLEIKATAIDAVVTPSADCLNAVEVTSGMKHTQAAGTQWYNFPVGLLNDGGHAGKVSIRNLSSKTAHLTAGVTVGCEYGIASYGSFKLPKELGFSLTIPTSILAKARKLIDADITNFYLQLTSDQDIVVGLDLDASDVKDCANAVPFDWSAWEKNGLRLQGNQDIWYEVNLRYPWEKMKKGEDLVLSVTNNNDYPVEFEASVSPTCPVIFNVESYATIPAQMSAQEVIAFSQLTELLKKFDRQLYNHENELILEKYQALVVLNKIDNLLGKYGKYFPVSKLYALLDKYGKYIAYEEVANLIDKSAKYVSVAELKRHLAMAKDQMTIANAIALLDKFDDYVPYVDAEKILNNYEAFLPYAGGAVVMLQKCEKYIPVDGIKQFVVKAKNAIPMDQIKALFNKIEERFPRDLNCYMHIKTTGELIVEPDTIVPAPDGCQTAIEYIWGTDVTVDQESWYKVSIVEVRNQDCDIVLTVANNTNDTVRADLSLYDACDATTPFASLKNVGIAPLTTRTKTIPASDLPADIDTLYLYVLPTGSLTINMSTDCPVFSTVTKTVTDFVCDGDTYLDPITGTVHTISSAVADSWTWSDTVHVNKNLDSVYTYVVTPKVAPIKMTDSILAIIPGAKPQLTPGTTPDMTASADSIKAYYLAQDNEATADVVKVEWAATPIACGATTHTMTLTVEDECGNLQTADFTLNVTTPTLDVTNHTVTICATELPYTWNGITYNAEGTHTTILSNIYGCDSAQVNMTINLYPAIPETVVDTTICHGESYTWNLNKQTYNQTGSDTITVASINGCDSVVILNLTVLPEIVSYDTVTVCYGDTYRWAEANLDCKRKGDYQYTFTSVEGCDSVANLHVKWLPKVEYKPDTVVTICYDQIPYVWMGNPYSATGIYNDTTLNRLGCDSIIHTLDLTVLPEAVIMPTDYVTINEGESYNWPVNKQNYATQGVYNHVEPNALGCDGIIYTLDLTVIPTHVVETKTITDLVCDGTEYVDPITGKKHIISSLIPSTQTWSDTVVVSSTLDSIYNFQITPVVAPEEMTDATLTAIAAVPVLTQGALPNVAGTLDAIKTYYQGKDDETIADVDSLYWTDASLNTPVTCGVTTHTMTLVVEAGCDNKITTIHTFDVQPIVGTTDTVVTCDSYTWNGQTYTGSGIYTFNATTVNGCDSVLTLDLTINKSFFHEETVKACDSYTWDVDGQTYSDSGDKYFNGKTAAGCDSTYVLHLTINKSFFHEETVEACDSYTWDVNGQTYSDSGDKYFKGKTAAGCDSTYVLHLTINKSFFHEETVEACDSYTWDVNGQTYSDSGDKYFNGKTVAGCDSTYVLHLTINKPVETHLYETVCDTYPWYGMNLTTSATYYHTLKTVNGCDSTLVLHLTVNNSFYKEETVVACESYEWPVNGVTYSDSGDKYFNGKTVAGCDSTYVLHLTINKPFFHEETVVACESYEWSVNGVTYSDSGDKYFNGKTAAGCDSTYVLHLTINKPFFHEETVVACESYEWPVNGVTYSDSGDKYFNGKTVAGCDSTYVLHLTINKPVKEDVYETACVSYTWNGQTYYDTGDYTFNGQTAAGCDSIVTLHLTILPDVVYEPKEIDYFCPGSTYDWYGHSFDVPGTYTHTLQNALGCDSIVYTLELLQYVNTLPAITADDIIAVCGNAVDVTVANDIIWAHIVNEATYAPYPAVRWYVLSGNTYAELTNTAIDGNVTEVIVKYTVTTDCGVVESDPITVQVQQPTPENDADMIDVPAYSHYGDRLLLIDLKHIENTYGWDVAEEDVTWYYVVDGMDDYASDAAKNDSVLGHGYYYNEATGNPVKPGIYYARIAHTATSTDCGGVLQTVLLTCVTSNLAPALVPTIAKPEELIRLINLNPAEVSTITVYSSTGENLGTYQASNTEEMTFKAAHVAGYYIVEVLTESGKVSLRYVVK